MDTTGYQAGDPADVSVINTDDEIPGFSVSGISGSTGEDGSTAEFAVTLNSHPSGDVVVSVESSDTTEGSVSPESITFTDANWDSEKTVTVKGADDDMADGNQEYTVRLTLDSSATTDTTGYGSLDPDDVSVVNTDNESTGFTVSEISGDTGEDGTEATFTVRLNSAPDGDVVIDAVSSDDSEGSASLSALTFTAGNWGADQTVTVTGADDAVADGDQGYRITLSVNTAETADTTGYAGLDPDDVSVVNTDNETAGFTIGKISGDTGEDGTDIMFTLRLNSRPDGDVVIDVESSDNSEGTATPTMLTISGENWNASHTVTVTGVDDEAGDGDQSYVILLTVNAEMTTDTTGYAELDPEDMPVVNLDNESPGFCVGYPSGQTGEDGTSAELSISLSRQPNGNVVLDAASSDTGEGTVSPATLTFDASNWETWLTVTATGVDDTVEDGVQRFWLELTVSTAQTTDTTGYAELDPEDRFFMNVDNDSPGYYLSTNRGTTGEDGASESFFVRLTSQPSGDVVLDVSSSDESEGSASPSALTFTPENWDTKQSVTVTGTDDADADGDTRYIIRLDISQAGTTDTSGYADSNPPNVTFINQDDDGGSSCSDGLQNGDETDTDCGGSNCPPCPDVAPETCRNGVQDEDESGADCGGNCLPCRGTPPPANCTDGVLSGTETSVDCGGNCPPCDGKPLPPHCGDGILNGNEVMTDCGGGCPDCPSCPGDVDSDHRISLNDAILVLQLLTGIRDGELSGAADVSADGRIDLVETVFILQTVGGVR